MALGCLCLCSAMWAHKKKLAYWPALLHKRIGQHKALVVPSKLSQWGLQELDQLCNKHMWVSILHLPHSKGLTNRPWP